MGDLLLPRQKDWMWQYVDPEDGTSHKRLSCKLCVQSMKEGVSQLKYHLAKIPGHDVSICTESTSQGENPTPRINPLRGSSQRKREQLGSELGISSGYTLVGVVLDTVVCR